MSCLHSLILFTRRELEVKPPAISVEFVYA